MSLDRRLDEWKHILLSAADDRERMKLLIEIGEELKEPSTLGEPIKGCVSEAWIQGSLKQGHVMYEGWAKGLIIKGYVQLLITLLNDLEPLHIVSSTAQMKAFIEQTHLSVSLVPSRANAFENLYAEMLRIAQTYVYKKKRIKKLFDDI